jgi:hypothetical protein
MRTYRWTRSVLWEFIVPELQRIADTKSSVDWEVHMIDGTNVRAHRCAAGANGVAPENYHRLLQEFDFEERKSLAVKGKGRMTTWLLKQAPN